MKQARPRLSLPARERVPAACGLARSVSRSLLAGGRRRHPRQSTARRESGEAKDADGVSDRDRHTVVCVLGSGSTPGGRPVWKQGEGDPQTEGERRVGADAGCTPAAPSRPEKGAHSAFGLDQPRLSVVSRVPKPGLCLSPEGAAL